MRIIKIPQMFSAQCLLTEATVLLSSAGSTILLSFLDRLMNPNSAGNLSRENYCNAASEWEENFFPFVGQGIVAF